MATYIHELLCVDSLGAVSVVHLAIQDDDPNLTSQEADAIYSLDGTALAAAPEVTIRQLQVTLVSGAATSLLTMGFTEGGKDYYLIPDSTPADAVASAGSYTSSGTVGSIAYTGYGAIQAEVLRPFQGQGFLRSVAGGNPAVDHGLADITVYDDDDLIETASETGALAQGHAGYHGQDGVFGASAFDPLSGLGPSAIRLVDVDYSGDAGAGSFEAIEFTFTRYGTTYLAYIPRLGAVDLADVTTITAVTALAGSLDGAAYADFGLDFDRHVTTGGTGDDVYLGNWLHDEMRGKGGDDTLVGGIGQDKLLGAGGADALFGGTHDDTLDGGSGGDNLTGGAQDDSLIGGDGADELFGGFDDDILDGGKKADLLQGNQDNDALFGGGSNDDLVGGSGADTLEGGDGDDDLSGGGGADEITDGAGADTATGGNGADVFLFAADGATDTITDFQDGSDLIDVFTAFSGLVITDIAPGEVHVSHGGDLLVILDSTGTLTAADLTRDDFL